MYTFKKKCPSSKHKKWFGIQLVQKMKTRFLSVALPKACQNHPGQFFFVFCMFQNFFSIFKMSKIRHKVWASFWEKKFFVVFHFILKVVGALFIFCVCYRRIGSISRIGLKQRIFIFQITLKKIFLFLIRTCLLFIYQV